MLDRYEADPERGKKEARTTGICLAGRAFDFREGDIQSG
jgi:hypothetical protein